MSLGTWASPIRPEASTGRAWPGPIRTGPKRVRIGSVPGGPFGHNSSKPKRGGGDGHGGQSGTTLDSAPLQIAVLAHSLTHGARRLPPPPPARRPRPRRHPYPVAGAPALPRLATSAPTPLPEVSDLIPAGSVPVPSCSARPCRMLLATREGSSLRAERLCVARYEVAIIP
jgi:hypothetical protein